MIKLSPKVREWKDRIVMAGILLLFTIILVVVAGISASDLHASENSVTDTWCAEMGGKRARFYEYKRYLAEVDCLTKDFAIEAEYAEKWHSSIGQSLWYSYLWQRRPAILLILKSGKNEKHLTRLRKTLKGRTPPRHYGLVGSLDIRVFVKRLY